MAAKTLVVSRIVASVQHMSGGSETNHRVAFVTCAEFPDGHVDDVPAVAPIIPTTFAEPGTDATDIVEAVLAMAATADDFVVKPSVGAGLMGAGRFQSDDPNSVEQAIKHIGSLLEADR